MSFLDYNIYKVEETDSTLNLIKNVRKQLPANRVGDRLVVVADYQTAGRGQGTNTWESAPCKNLLFSLYTPIKNVAANAQFIISKAGALAIKTVLDTYAEGFSIKWPNDIYWHDKKISGTLITTTISGRNIQDCVFSVGINVNQQEFRSDAPNPVSLRQIIGKDVNRDELLAKIIEQFEQFVSNIDAASVDEEYHVALYRKEGDFAYEDEHGAFMARIIKVKDNGHLLLLDNENHEREYELKEVRFVLPRTAAVR